MALSEQSDFPAISRLREMSYRDKAILLIIKPLKMVICSFCDGVPLKFKKKTGGPPVYQYGLFEHSIDPC